MPAGGWAPRLSPAASAPLAEVATAFDMPLDELKDLITKVLVRLGVRHNPEDLP